MANLNKVMLIGRLTRDPELKYTQGGTAIAEIGLAVNETWKDKNGEKKEESVFVDVTMWGRQAEIANQYLSKGSEVFIEGRLKLDQWESNQGEKRSKLRVTGTGMQFIGGRNGNGNGGQDQGGGYQAGGGNQYAGQAQPQYAGSEDIIPF